MEDQIPLLPLNIVWSFEKILEVKSDPQFLQSSFVVLKSILSYMNTIVLLFFQICLCVHMCKFLLFYFLHFVIENFMDHYIKHHAPKFVTFFHFDTLL